MGEAKATPSSCASPELECRRHRQVIGLRPDGGAIPLSRQQLADFPADLGSARVLSSPTQRHYRTVDTPHSTVASRILIADPDADVRASYRRLLTLEGRDILDAADGRDALVKALVRAPHLVITELDLPFVDGFSLCDILRRDPQTRHVPILVVTHDRANVVRAQRCGADVVLVKPPNADAIRRTTSRLLEQGRTCRARAQAAIAKAVEQRQRSSELLGRSRDRRMSARARQQGFDDAAVPGVVAQVPNMRRAAAIRRKLRWRRQRAPDRAVGLLHVSDRMRKVPVPSAQTIAETRLIRLAKPQPSAKFIAPSNARRVTRDTWH